MGVLDLLRASTSNVRRGKEAAGFRVSAPFTLRNNGTISSAATVRHDIETNKGSFSTEAGDKIKRFMPYSRCSIQNNSSEIIDFYINSDLHNKVTVLNRATQDLSDIELWRFSVTNQGDSAFGADKIVVTCWNE